VSSLHFRINSGIPSKAFYELAKRLKGYAWEKPAKIWYEAYLTLNSASKFQDLADAMVKVATRMHGTGSPEREAVVQSWAEVGITTGR
jgi:Zn-dependent metalloprotease